jgi:amino acid adenylation domain-containing protein/thioester reductase-like protein
VVASGQLPRPAGPNGPCCPGDRTVTVLRLISDQAALTPGRVAVVAGGESLTYEQLDGRSSALAGELAAAGVGRGDLTPLLMGNALGLPLAMVALMKIAAPFVPVDELWPRARIAAVLADLDPKAVLCAPELSHLPAGRGAVVRVDAGALTAAARPGPAAEPSSGDLIYGFYTSGSTGVPKCALNAHLGLVNRFRVMTRRFGADGQVVLQNSRPAFDSAIWQLLWPLTTGGMVVIPQRRGLLDLSQTCDVIERHAVTMTDFVPSIFNALVPMVRADPALQVQLRSLRRLLIGGEEISPRAVRDFQAVMPAVALTNTYGPTECSIGSVFHEIGSAGPIPLGRPIDNTAAVVLDDSMRPLPPGERGEIYLGGDCLGRGYLNDPAKTAAAFVRNAVPSIPGDTLYRTGDLGWTGEDGTLFFAGRRDQQVKLGGVRVELPEVEAALAQHPGVRDAKAVVAGDQRRRLVGCVLLADPHVRPAMLHEHLAGLLPAGSRPADIIVMAEFPRTPNGKVDRRALAALARGHRADGPDGADGPAPAGAGGADGPVSDLERRIQQIWSGLLDVTGVSVTASFFGLGGDSVLAHRLAVALRPLIGRLPAVREIVEHPTIRGQAALADRAGGSGRGPVERMRADSQLPAGTGPGPQGPWALRTVLLTGATGFVGAHILAELLARTDSRVICLVRAGSESQGRLRVARALDRYGLGPAARSERVRMLSGDLARPRLGLDPVAYAALAEIADTIIHSGAMVNLLLDYDSHHPANVAGTMEVLRLMGAGRRKHLHHLSTFGVFPGCPPGARTVAESLEPQESALPGHGYGQSKWVAERLVLAARGQGMAVTVHRMGQVAPHSVTGIPSPGGLVDRMARAVLAAGCYPVTSATTDYTPVDYVAQLVVAAAARGQAGANLHLMQSGGLPLTDLFRLLAGPGDAREVPYDAFWHALGELDDDALRLQALLPEPAGDAAEDERRLGALLGDASARFAADGARRLGADAGIMAPPRGAALDRYAHACARQAQAAGADRARLRDSAVAT